MPGSWSRKAPPRPLCYFRKLDLLCVLNWERAVVVHPECLLLCEVFRAAFPMAITWHSCSFNSERSHLTICQSAVGREPISIHCVQLFIWKSTSNVPIHIALLHFSTFMSVIAFIFLVKTAKQVTIYYIIAHIGWVCSHNSSNLPSRGLGG